VRTNRTYARAAIADAAFSRSCCNVNAAMQPTSWKRPFKATISVDFKPTFRRVMFELTHRGLCCRSPYLTQRLLPAQSGHASSTQGEDRRPSRQFVPTTAFGHRPSDLQQLDHSQNGPFWNGPSGRNYQQQHPIIACICCIYSNCKV
jgi:hypothetical protein